jgi:Secretion system C-terminal sorting domain
MRKIFLIPVLLFLWNSSWAQCPLSVTITGAYTTTYTGTNSWIKSNGITTIPTGANVTLDANPKNNGYVLLDAGFETKPNSIFLAIVKSECFPLSINHNLIENEMNVYSNPVNDEVNIQAKSKILQAAMMDIHGKLIMASVPNSNTAKFNMSLYSTGVYLLTITTDAGTRSIKINKN